MRNPFGHDARPSGGPGAADPVDSNTAPVVDFYWRPGCPFCMLLKRSVKKRNLAVRYHNIWEDPEAAATVRAAAWGNETVPTVAIAGHMLVNPSIGAVEDLLAGIASGELAPRT